ncbi:MAG: aminopeptidase [Treponema sp.]|jgi:predicted aminopeptidase|nr:aminopeptidase [Treponema sp.]
MKHFPAGFMALLPAPVSALILMICLGFFSGCYTLKQGTTMLGYLSRAVPLENLEGEENIEFARTVAGIRRFAMEDLGLKESKNYTRYVELDRDYLAAVVSASAKDSFTTHEWQFPVVGKVPYKGFFNIEDARKEREKLLKKDLDVWIRSVDAFSTLGWFKDPLYSYMKNYTRRELADLIIHELFHATVFIKNQVQFNEELAEFVGSEGSRLYIEKTFGHEAAREEDRRGADLSADRDTFLKALMELKASLEAVYKDGALAREEKLLRKAEIISGFQTRFAGNYDSLYKTENYRGFSGLPINNAYLELYNLYYGEGDYFKELYEKSGRNLKAFIEAAKSIKGKTEDPRSRLERALGLH